MNRRHIESGIVHAWSWVTDRSICGFASNPYQYRKTHSGITCQLCKQRLIKKPKRKPGCRSVGWQLRYDCHDRLNRDWKLGRIITHARCSFRDFLVVETQKQDIYVYEVVEVGGPLDGKGSTPWEEEKSVIHDWVMVEDKPETFDNMVLKMKCTYQADVKVKVQMANAASIEDLEEIVSHLKEVEDRFRELGAVDFQFEIEHVDEDTL